MKLIPATGLGKYKYVHALALPCLAYFLIFKYLPMYGAIVAFKDYQGVGGFWGILTADWTGFFQFERFFNSIYFLRLMKNTLLISLYRLLFIFPFPIVLALLLNEIRGKHFKRTVQTITYMPYFLSWVVVSGFVAILLSPSDGPVNQLLAAAGLEPVYFLADKRFFRSILVASNLWKDVGWSSIIYLAAIAGINTEQYEAARIDGAGRWRIMFRITLPELKELIAILLILAIGKILDENFEQILNLYNEVVYDVADVFETYVYRQGIVQGQFAFSAAVNLFKSFVSLLLVLLANRAAKKLGAGGLW